MGIPQPRSRVSVLGLLENVSEGVWADEVYNAPTVEEKPPKSDTGICVDQSGIDQSKIEVSNIPWPVSSLDFPFAF